jgi:DNA mismatch repair protein MutH
MDDPFNEPRSEDELIRRARRLAGQRLTDLARATGTTLPREQRFAKGWTGQQLEKYLGASAGSLPEPDFRALGIELKTLPVNSRGQPRESTYVCTVPMQSNAESNWESSWVRRKLQRVLWIPIQAEKDQPLAERRIGNPLLWSPDAHQASALQQDWEELMEMVSLGRFAEISARHGRYLQIRPKAADSRALCLTHDDQGMISQTLPRGFYLRTRLTAQILQAYALEC